MRSRITWKLIGYFAFVLLLFAIAVGLLFNSLFGRYTVEHHEDDLKLKAASLSRTFSGYLASGEQDATEDNFRHYLTLLDGLTTSEIWIVDKASRRINLGDDVIPHNYEEMEGETRNAVEQIFDGYTISSEAFADLLGRPVLTVGAPIMDIDRQVIAALLIHSSIDGPQAVMREGIQLLLLASALGLLMAVICAVILSMHFIRPIRAMQIAANHMAEGDYHVSTGIVQKDELGALAGDLDMLALRLETASEESQKLVQLRNDFVSNVSHELRTPVSVIRGSLEALCDKIVSDETEVDEFHRNMLGEAIHLQRMINDLLELSRLQNPDFVMQFAPMDIQLAVSDALRAADQLADAKGVSIARKLSDDDVGILGDYGRIRQLILILLDNAVKFSKKGDTVTVELLREKQCIILRVKDEGKGIAPSDLLHIFNRFYTVPDADNDSGTGLGLSIAKQIAIRHNAIIDVESREGQGSVFVVRFSPIKGSPNF